MITAVRSSAWGAPAVNSTMACTLVCAKMGIRVAHVEADGERDERDRRARDQGRRALRDRPPGRELIGRGGLKRMVDRDGLGGVTSNPAIFEKAVRGGSAYDEQILALARQGLSSAEIVDRIFDWKFTTKGEGHTGLGLAGAYGIIKSHGGAIEFESAAGAGTTVAVLLPLANEGKENDGVDGAPAPAADQG